MDIHDSKDAEDDVYNYDNRDNKDDVDIYDNSIMMKIWMFMIIRVTKMMSMFMLIRTTRTIVNLGCNPRKARVVGMPGGI